jgi:hypothetical protein
LSAYSSARRININNALWSLYLIAKNMMEHLSVFMKRKRVYALSKQKGAIH